LRLIRVFGQIVADVVPCGSGGSPGRSEGYFVADVASDEIEP
jgi:hypothetical protein